MDDNQNNDVEEPSFADLLESYSDGMKDDLQVGDKITGKIISIGKDTVFVDTGTKIDGAAEKKELLDEDQEFPYNVGDTLELYVVAMSEDEIRLSRALSGIGGYHMLR
ncbi:MAG: S1 RNA-binding domain-containing protein, partial [Deltaproteobacteria bacterium]|nr:S1 RNA-binding domain-containing protein [Deltaproteobacteria bacterium]